MEKEFRQLIKYIKNDVNVCGSVYRQSYDENTKTFSFRFVPHDFDIDRLTTMEKYFKLADIEIVEDIFDCDLQRTNGYRDYHDIVIKSKGYFGKPITKELFE